MKVSSESIWHSLSSLTKILLGIKYQPLSYLIVVRTQILGSPNGLPRTLRLSLQSNVLVIKNIHIFVSCGRVGLAWTSWIWSRRRDSPTGTGLQIIQKPVWPVVGATLPDHQSFHQIQATAETKLIFFYLFYPKWHPKSPLTTLLWLPVVMKAIYLRRWSILWWRRRRGGGWERAVAAW